MPGLAVLVAATAPLVYYGIALYSSGRFFRASRRKAVQSGFTPPVSNLRPIRGLDAEAYENCATLCRQDYPDYELLFCVGSPQDPVVPVLEKLARDFPERKIRIIVESGQSGSNDKVAKLARLVAEAQNDVLVINDSDVQVGPDYLRTVVAPLADPAIGAVTCFYASKRDDTLAEDLHTVGMMSDFFAGVLVARQLDGVKFAIGKTIVTTRAHLERFGGYASLVDRPGDDLLVGRFIAGQGLTVEILPYSVTTVSGHAGLRDFFHKRLRWIVVMRHMRPGGHFGLLFTLGLPWMVAALLARPPLPVALAYVGAYAALRVAMTWTIGIHGLKLRGLWGKMPLIPVWDALAFVIWLASFTRSKMRWRDGEYYIRNGKLVPVIPVPAED